jgi:hypothetical protein
MLTIGDDNTSNVVPHVRFFSIYMVESPLVKMCL